eukprot:gene11209-4029_t
MVTFADIPEDVVKYVILPFRSAIMLHNLELLDLEKQKIRKSERINGKKYMMVPHPRKIAWTLNLSYKNKHLSKQLGGIFDFENTKKWMRVGEIGTLIKIERFNEDNYMKHNIISSCDYFGEKRVFKIKCHTFKLSDCVRSYGCLQNKKNIYSRLNRDFVTHIDYSNEKIKYVCLDICDLEDTEDSDSDYDF